MAGFLFRNACIRRGSIVVSLWTLSRSQAFVITSTTARRALPFVPFEYRYPLWLSTSSDATDTLVDDTSNNNYESWSNDDDVADSPQEVESNEDDALQQEISLWSKAVQKQTNALQKKQTSLQSEWQKAQDVEKTMARAQLLTSNLYLFKDGTRSAVVQDWEQDGKEVLVEVSDDYESASAEADALFDKARKLKRGSKKIQELLQETERALDMMRDAEMDLESCEDEGRLRLVQDRLKRTAKTTNFKVPSLQKQDKQRTEPTRTSSPLDNVRKLKSPNGLTVWVGKNRRGNEYISLNMARGKDIWMHARGCPGAHVLIQSRGSQDEITEDCLQFAANLAIFYSDARMERRAMVTCAEPKHILKPRGAPLGAVKIRQELYTQVGFPDEVPSSLKEARDESGQMDEYHAKDKAKHRRKTQQVAKQSQAKKRAEARAKRKRRNAKQ